jgi:hypothetical protein
MGLPIPETWCSWEKKGQSEKAAAGDRKEKVSQMETLGGRRGVVRCSFQEQRESCPSSCKLGPAGKLQF